MASDRKKSYMKSYNQLPHVKASKAAYMRRIRANTDEDASKNLVRMLLDMGYENLAFEYAQERAPEMLATIKMPVGF
jgi:ribulose bisphosphate carboxylase small subunit